MERKKVGGGGGRGGGERRGVRGGGGGEEGEEEGRGEMEGRRGLVFSIIISTSWKNSGKEKITFYNLLK